MPGRTVTLTFADLPIEVRQRITEFCGYATLFQLRRVCTTWSRCCNQSSLWVSLSLRQYQLASETSYSIRATPIETQHSSSATDYGAGYAFSLRRRPTSGVGLRSSVYSSYNAAVPHSDVKTAAKISTSQWICFDGINDAERLCITVLSRIGFTFPGEASARDIRPAIDCDECGSVYSPSTSNIFYSGSQWDRYHRGALLTDALDSSHFAYYLATSAQPWCTVLMDKLIIDSRFLTGIATKFSGTDRSEGSLHCSFEVLLRVEMIDKPYLGDVDFYDAPPAIRIGVIPAAEAQLYQLLNLTSAAASRPQCSVEDPCGYFEPSRDPNHTSRSRTPYDTYTSAGTTRAAAWQSASPIVTAGDPYSDEAIREEVSEWFAAAVQDIMSHEPSTTVSQSDPKASQQPIWTKQSFASARSPSSSLKVGDSAGPTGVIGDTASSYAYDNEGCHITNGTSYQLGTSLQHNDIVKLRFSLDEDVIILLRNDERIGLLVTDAFSEQQRWCVGVSLHHCGVQLIPPVLRS